MPNFQNAIFFMDKASPHYKSKKVIRYFEENKVTLIPIYLPTASLEFMVMEEVWNIAKRDLLILQYCSSFADFKNKISRYFITKRFNLDMRNYLLRDEKYIYNISLLLTFQFISYPLLWRVYQIYYI
jgi:hypothetical protein